MPTPGEGDLRGGVEPVASVACGDRLESSWRRSRHVPGNPADAILGRPIFAISISQFGARELTMALLAGWAR